MDSCFACEYYGEMIDIPATCTRVVDGIEVDVCAECAKWYDQFEAERKETSGNNER